jgi:hypothetical protein
MKRMSAYAPTRSWRTLQAQRRLLDYAAMQRAGILSLDEIRDLIYGR